MEQKMNKNDDVKEIIRYEENPFLDNLVVSTKNKSIKLSRLGKDENILINQATGEVQGTHITTYKKVDNDEFVKIFTRNIGLIFDLKAAGIKALNVLIFTISNSAINKDLVVLDKYALEKFIEVQPEYKLSRSTFDRGLRELVNAQIIARHTREGWYFINPNFIFNGDRIAFTTLIERKKADTYDNGEVQERLDI